jgi:beta-lactamase regulating signal transducer with metallopeptidase domain/sporulation protein YlmC with PRC-barrel domain
MITTIMIGTTTTASMNDWMTWLSPTTYSATQRALGWALLHFLWQGTALAALAAAAMNLCRRATTRYAVGLATLVLMLAAPVVTFLYLQHASLADTDDVSLSPVASVARPIEAKMKTVIGSTSSLAVTSRDAFPWLVEAWLLGVTLLSLRTAGGFLLIGRERRKHAVLLSPQMLEICLELHQRLGLKRAVAFCEAAWLQAPTVIGWFRPIVFLPVSALSGLSEDQLRSVIAHELAHIRRLDTFVNVFQIWVETLLFYHPAVWWLNKKIRAEREHCCDEVAVAVCGNAVEYARALTLMEEWRTAPALAMAANRGPLRERIVRVLGLKTLGTGMRTLGLTGSILCLLAALAAGHALFGIAYPKPTDYAAGTLRSLFNGAAPQSQATPQATSQPAPQAASTPAPKPSAGQSQTGEPVTAQSYIDGMKSAGLEKLTADELIALKVQDVTPEYIRQMRDLGLQPDVDELVGLKVQGVTPEYVKELRALGFNPDADEIIGMKVQGVNANYVREMKEAGIDANADEIVGLKVQGVTAAYVRELRTAGLTVNADDVIGLKVQGVTAAYVQGLRDQGLHPNADEVVGMKVQGVTPDYIRDIRATGLNPSADDLIGMKVQGVTAEFIKTLQSAGFKPSVDDVISAKVQGLTRELIDEALKHEFKNLTIEQLIEMKQMGILESKPKASL